MFELVKINKLVLFLSVHRYGNQVIKGIGRQGYHQKKIASEIIPQKQLI